jgi:hypothetical protein
VRQNLLRQDSGTLLRLAQMRLRNLRRNASRL